MSRQLTQAREGISATRGTEAENILGAAREDAGFEKLLKFKKGEYLIGEELVPLGMNTSRTPSAGPNAGSSS